MYQLTTQQVFELEQRHKSARKRRWIIAEYDEQNDVTYLIGDTYRRIGRHTGIRERFKADGGQWVKELQAWTFPGRQLPDYIETLVDDVAFIGVASGDGDTGEIAGDQDTDLADPVENGAKPVLNGAKPALPEWYAPPSWFSTLDTYLALLKRPAIAIVGPAGNGKTTTAEIALQHNGISYEIMNCTDRTEVLDLIGGDILTAEGEIWRDGIVTRAFREGKGIVLDEADALDPRVMMALQTALLDPGPESKSRFVATPEGKVMPKGHCPIIMTMNTFGAGANREYTGRNKLDSASMDRLTVLHTRFENETQILMAHGYKRDLSQKIVKWASETRQKIDENGAPIILSPRTMLRIAECVSIAKWSFDIATYIEFYDRIDPKYRYIFE